MYVLSHNKKKVLLEQKLHFSYKGKADFFFSECIRSFFHSVKGGWGRTWQLVTSQRVARDSHLMENEGTDEARVARDR